MPSRSTSPLGSDTVQAGTAFFSRRRQAVSNGASVAEVDRFDEAFSEPCAGLLALVD